LTQTGWESARGERLAYTSALRSLAEQASTQLAAAGADFADPQGIVPAVRTAQAEMGPNSWPAEWVAELRAAGYADAAIGQVSEQFVATDPGEIAGGLRWLRATSQAVAGEPSGQEAHWASLRDAFAELRAELDGCLPGEAWVNS
ncbi:MAG TPA: hypothetical protein VFK80_03355, partial [Limnochordia bacterium]|nr:hypothetical protein [Limnochordia bacterium]